MFKNLHFHYLTALGFTHMHNVPSRGEFIQINIDNIKETKKDKGNEGDEENKEKKLAENGLKMNERSQLANVNFPYDFGSILHYPPGAGAKDGLTSFDVLENVRVVKCIVELKLFPFFFSIFSIRSKEQSAIQIQPKLVCIS